MTDVSQNRSLTGKLETWGRPGEAVGQLRTLKVISAKNTVFWRAVSPVD